MSLEFSFFVRDRLVEYFQPEDLDKLEIKDFPYTHTKEVVLGMPADKIKEKVWTSVKKLFWSTFILSQKGTLYFNLILAFSLLLIN